MRRNWKSLNAARLRLIKKIQQLLRHIIDLFMDGKRKAGSVYKAVDTLIMSDLYCVSQTESYGCYVGES